MELGVVPTSYIATTTAAVTRNADALTIATSSFPYSLYEGTLYIEGAAPNAAVGVQQTLVSLDDASTNNSMLEYIQGGSLYSFHNSGGTTQASIAFGSINTQFYRIAHGIILNNSNAALNGVIGTADTTCTMPAAATTLRLGSAYNIQNPCWVRHIAYFPRRLVDADLIKLTT